MFFQYPVPISLPVILLKKITHFEDSIDIRALFLFQDLVDNRTDGRKVEPLDNGQWSKKDDIFFFNIDKIGQGFLIMNFY